MKSPAKRLRVAFVVAILIVALNLSVPNLGRRWVDSAQSSQEELTQLITHSELLLSALKDGETGQRGYVISGRDDFLTPMLRGYVDVDGQLQNLASAFADDPPLERLLVQLEKRIADQRAYFQDIINLRRSEGLVVAAERIGAGTGKRLMEEMRRLIGEIEAELNGRLHRVQQEVAWRVRIQEFAMVSITVLDLLVLVGLFIFTFRFIRDIQRNEERSHRLSDQLAEGMRQLETRNREISLLSLMAEALHSSKQYQECYEIIDRFARQLFPNNRGGLFLYHPSRDVLERVSAWGEWQDASELFEPEQCWAIRRGQSHQVRDPDKDLICSHLKAHIVENEGYLCVPLMAQGDPLGVLTLGTHESHDRGLAEAFAEQISLGISNLSLRESLRQQSVVDPLTSLHNRRFLDESFRIELLRATRKQTPMAVVMLDIDHFKRFNDTFGHDAGDLVLRQLALEMKRHVRASDLLCRFGGEEFVLVLGEIEREDAIARCEALRLAVSRLHLRYGGQSLGPLSISLGMACFPDCGEDAEALLLAADAALYRAKASGRNRLCLFEDTEVSETEPATDSEPV